MFADTSPCGLEESALASQGKPLTGGSSMGWLKVIISISRDNIFQKDVNVLTHRHKLRVFISDYIRTLIKRGEG